MAAAAILKPNVRHSLLQDSKLLTPQERDIAYRWLLKNATFGVGITHHRLIDSLNIYYATLVAMNRAVMQLLSICKREPSIILVDAMPLAFEVHSIPVVHFIYGERQSKSIAAASIIAKVTRDALMSRMDALTPGYDYTNNKGYGTRAHKEGIQKAGITVLHRLNFVTHITSGDTQLPLLVLPTSSQEETV